MSPQGSKIVDFPRVAEYLIVISFANSSVDNGGDNSWTQSAVNVEFTNICAYRTHTSLVSIHLNKK